MNKFLKGRNNGAAAEDRENTEDGSKDDVINGQESNPDLEDV